MRQDIITCPAQRHPVTTLTHEFSADHEIPAHTHPEHQLIYACHGVMTVWTDLGKWVVPPQRAVWIPAKTPHGITMYGPVSMRTLYVKPRLMHPSRECCVVNVSPLLRELILHACRVPALRRRVKADARLVEMIIDQLEIMETSPLELINPKDPRAARVADALSADPGDHRPLADICRLAGASKRTIERLFQTETNMSLGGWRQQLRLLHSLRLLAAGEPITRVALESGYSTPSSFIAMFRKALGTTPHRYFENHANVAGGRLRYAASSTVRKSSRMSRQRRQCRDSVASAVNP